VRSVDQAAAREIADRVLKMKTVGEIKGFLTARLQEVCPNIAMFDTFQ